jgi:chromosome partitioning protein
MVNHGHKQRMDGLMAEIICVIGNKGGTGKTTLSHMLCQGLGLLGQRAACVLTDTSREPLLPNGRRYVTADARTRDALTKVVDKLRTLDDWIGVIDGGGNRTEMDRKLYAMSDIVLLPFRESHEDIRTVVRDLEMFPRAYAVPTQWPNNAWQRDAADRTVALLMGSYRHRILRPVNALSSSKLLLQKEVPEHLPTPLSNACRAVARQVLQVLEIDFAENTGLDEHNSDSAPLPASEMPMRLANPPRRSH